ncbi:SDR family oxidoreductase [Streptantibioticus ferralitis]|uniref:SDR family oxidoreductase n=1 Tax=Streptantibioticus ferralitis TaxID=236510 RepID=A0ABT5Z777_9ACTN|nr:SDR family oxidoreductase [Streptantibioticus ferralitis]MDF2258885.1 SDR family oxidoreductase [Streptantibioticus ferralitis]
MIGITGASGGLGRAAAELLLESVEAREVVLATRRPESLADLAERGAEVRRADFAAPGSLVGAFAGIDRLLLVSITGVERVEQHRAAIEAARAAGVRHVAYTSVVEPVPANPAAKVDDHARTEQVLRDSGLAWTFLRNNLYAEIPIPVIEQAIASGRLVSNSGAGATSYVSRDDCAAAAVGVLTQDGHEERIYDVTGPEAWTAADLAALAGRLGGREIELVDLDDAVFAAQLRGGGVPEAVVPMLTSFGAAARAGHLARVTSVVPDLTGRPARALTDVVGPRVAR